MILFCNSATTKINKVDNITSTNICWADMHDVNCDGCVNAVDADLISDVAASGGYDLDADVNRDGLVTMADRLAVFSCMNNSNGSCGIYKEKEVIRKQYCPHDTNCDGVVTAVDALYVYSVVAAGGYDEYADVDRNGLVTALDAIAVYQCAANNGSCCLTTGC